MFHISLKVIKIDSKKVQIPGILQECTKARSLKTKVAFLNIEYK